MSPVLILIVVYLIVFSVHAMKYSIAEEKAYKALSALVPRSKQIIVEVDSPQTTGLNLFPESYNFAVTTKEDYKHWKKIVLKRGHFLGNSNFQFKKRVNEPKYCEIAYKTTQTVKRGKPDDNILMYCGDDGFIKSTTYNNKKQFKTWNLALKYMYDNFTYVPSNQELEKKWNFPTQNVKEMSGYRKSVNK